MLGSGHVIGGLNLDQGKKIFWGNSALDGLLFLSKAVVLEKCSFLVAKEERRGCAPLRFSMP